MKKLIFRKFTKDTLVFFTTSILIMGIIVWTLQAVNYFDFVTQDGHGLEVYFLYTILNFPKIIHRILPFIFFISIFYMIISYELKNELSIFWINGISKVNFTNQIVLLSILVMVFQIILGSYVSPSSQYKARSYLKNSNIDFFTSLIKEGKFINAVKGLTIFIDKKNNDGSYTDIFIDDSTKNNSKMIYAKNGILVDNEKRKIFKLFQGKVISNEKSKINVFEFDQIEFNLKDFTSNTIVIPKIQEIKSSQLLNCLISENKKNSREFKCEKHLSDEIKQELLKRFYKPIYIPIITIMCCFLFTSSRNKINYNKIKRNTFIFTFFLIVFSETSLRYSTSSNLFLIFYFSIPLFIFILAYFTFYRIVKNV